MNAPPTMTQRKYQLSTGISRAQYKRNTKRSDASSILISSPEVLKKTPMGELTQNVATLKLRPTREHKSVVKHSGSSPLQLAMHQWPLIDRQIWYRLLVHSLRIETLTTRQPLPHQAVPLLLHLLRAAATDKGPVLRFTALPTQKIQQSLRGSRSDEHRYSSPRTKKPMANTALITLNMRVEHATRTR